MPQWGSPAVLDTAIAAPVAVIGVATFGYRWASTRQALR